MQMLEDIQITEREEGEDRGREERERRGPEEGIRTRD